MFILHCLTERSVTWGWRKSWRGSQSQKFTVAVLNSKIKNEKCIQHWFLAIPTLLRDGVEVKFTCELFSLFVDLNDENCEQEKRKMRFNIYYKQLTTTRRMDWGTRWRWNCGMIQPFDAACCTPSFNRELWENCKRKNNRFQVVRKLFSSFPTATDSTVSWLIFFQCAPRKAIRDID